MIFVMISNFIAQKHHVPFSRRPKLLLDTQQTSAWSRAPRASNNADCKQPPLPCTVKCSAGLVAADVQLEDAEHEIAHHSHLISFAWCLRSFQQAV